MKNNTNQAFIISLHTTKYIIAPLYAQFRDGYTNTIYNYKSIKNFKSFRKEMIISAQLTKHHFNNGNVFLDKMILNIDTYSPKYYEYKEGLFYDFKNTYKNYLISFRQRDTH
jgi:hypothetical protein